MALLKILLKIKNKNNYGENCFYKLNPIAS